MTSLPAANDPDSAVAKTTVRSQVIRCVVLVLVAVAATIVFGAFGNELTLAKLATHESVFRTYLHDWPIHTCLAAYSVYAAVTGLSLPGAAAMTLLYGWLFGFWRGLVLVSLGSTTGATLAFLLSRYLFRQTFTEYFGDRLAGFNAALQRESAIYLLTLRLIPAVPFFAINAVMGLTPIRVRTFWCVSQVGMLPGTIVYVYAGSSVPGLQTLAERGVNAVFSPGQMVQIFSALVLLGIFPLVVRRIMHRQFKVLKSQFPPSRDSRSS